jgi:hypothetical protein
MFFNFLFFQAFDAINKIKNLFDENFIKISIIIVTAENNLKTTVDSPC